MTRDKTASPWQAVRHDLTELHTRLAQLETQINSLESEHANLAVSEAEAGRTEMNLKSIARIVGSLSSLKSQEEILNQLLAESELFVDRAVIFIRRGADFLGWKGIGISEETVKKTKLSGSRDSVVEAAKTRRVVQVEGNLAEAFSWLADEETNDRSAVCIPLLFQDFAPAVFYGDAQRTIEIGSLEILIQLTTLVLQNHYLTYLLQPVEPEEGMRWPSLKTSESEGPAHDTAPRPLRVAFPPPGSAGEERPTRFPDQISADSEIADALRELEEDTTRESLADVTADDLEPSIFDDEITYDDVGAEFKEGLEEQAEKHPLADFAEGESGSPVEAVIDEQLEDEESTDEEALHLEARRLGRLLATEIKLYNEDQVNKGRLAGDLYTRLRAEIDRSREMYEKRAHPLVKTQVDYFHLELVRILAQDDESMMGSDYPGERLLHSSDENTFQTENQ